MAAFSINTTAALLSMLPKSTNMPNQDVFPDECLLNGIFPERRPTSISIVLQNWNKCIFKAEYSNGSTPHVVRLEAKDTGKPDFSMVAAMQQVANIRIPDLVPKIILTGNVTNASAREFHFSVMDFISGSTLEEVWDRMDDSNQTSIVTSVVKALEQLQVARFSDQDVQTVLRPVLERDGAAGLSAVMGGAMTGFLEDGPALLSSILNRWKLDKPFCRVDSSTDSDEIVIRSSFEELGHTTVKNSDMKQWPIQAVFCHNDITPRNILLRTSEDSNGRTVYELAAIIDWELAGFYPSSYQLSLQDTYLSSGNRHIRFYILLKEHMKELVPRSRSQACLLKVTELIFESRQAMLVKYANIPANIRREFIRLMQLQRDEDPYTGWTHKPGTDPLSLISYADMERLEDDIVAEMIAQRQDLR